MGEKKMKLIIYSAMVAAKWIEGGKVRKLEKLSVCFLINIFVQLLF